MQTCRSFNVFEILVPCVALNFHSWISPGLSKSPITRKIGKGVCGHTYFRAFLLRRKVLLLRQSFSAAQAGFKPGIQSKLAPNSWPSSLHLPSAGRIKGRGHNVYLRWRFDSFQGPPAGLANAVTGLWSWDAPGRGAIVEISSHTFLPSIFWLLPFLKVTSLPFIFLLVLRVRTSHFGSKCPLP